MSLTSTQAWEDGHRAIITDGSPGLGAAILHIAKERGIGTGGFVSGAWHKSWLESHRLVPVDEPIKAARLNILKSDATIILTEDPRTTEMEWIITHVKERHRRLAVVLNGSAQGINFSPLTKVIHITGTVPAPIAEHFTRELITYWNAEVKR